jgi:hypothetical protein
MTDSNTDPRAPYLFIAAMDVDADKLDLFNEVYDTEHVPLLQTVPGVVAVTRLVKQPLNLSIGGEVKDVDTADQPTFSAFYWIDSPDVLTSPAWAEAIEQGRWPEQVRPYTKNRRHTLLKVMDEL